MLALAALLACAPDDGGATPEPDGAAPDAPARPWVAFAGEVNVYATRDGLTTCDLEAVLTGADRADACVGCDFAFDVASTVAAGGGDCAPWSDRSFVELGPWEDLAMVHYPALDGAADVLVSRWGYYDTRYGYPIVETGTTRVAWDGSGYGDVRLDGDTLAWDLAFGGAGEDVYQFVEDCGTAEPSVATEALPGELVAAGTLPCAPTAVDVWTVEVDGTADLTVTVDTIAAESAGDSYVHVQDPDGCTVVFADDTHACAYPPAEHGCPSARVVAPRPGTYELVVWTWGGCAGETSAYALAIGGGTGLALAGDDVTTATAWTVAIAGTGTLTPAR